jgi:hypothetical protein
MKFTSLVKSVITILKRLARSRRVNTETKLDPIVSAVFKDKKKWNKIKKQTTGKKILIATSMAEYTHGSDLDRVLAIALTERGHQVSFSLCDSNLLACQIIKFSSYKPSKLIESTNTPRCSSCSSHIEKDFLPLGLPIYTYNKKISNEFDMQFKLEKLDMDALRNFEIDEVKIGMHAWAGAVRYFASTDFTKEVESKKILIRFIISGLRIVESVKSIIKDFSPDTIIAHHGIYVPQGILSEMAKLHGIALMTWTPSYRTGTFIFSPGESYHFSMISELNSKWKNLALTQKQAKSLSKYMESRKSGKNDWIKFSDSKVENKETPINVANYFLILTSVSWDAELHYKSRAFSNMREWLQVSIQFFKDNPKEKVIIRVHPAELTSPNVSREPMAEFIRSLRIDSHPNIILLGPDSSASTYELIEKSKAVIIYNTKTGIEAAYMGKPVIVAGEAWIKGKGIGWDAYSSDEYLKILDEFRNNVKMSKEMRKNSINYAFHFFFRRMIQVKLFSNPKNNRLIPNEISLRSIIGKKDKNFQAILDSIEDISPPVGN